MSSTVGHREAPAVRPPGWAVAVCLAVGAWFLVTHYLHVFTEAINWDEFALLERADRTLRMGEVVGGGRPGLVTLWLIPFVNGCIDSVRTVVNARLLWQGVTLAYLVGVYYLVRHWFVHAGRPAEGKLEAILSVALLAFIPAFVTWSVQVRTDQPALAAATWGGVLLLSTGYLSAAFAGILFAVGVLCTQKALYAIALCGVLFVTATVSRSVTTPFLFRTEGLVALRRITVAGVCALIVVGIYAWLVPNSTSLVSSAGLTSAMDSMNWYRQRHGYRIYTVHASRLVVHWVLFAALLYWTFRTAFRRDVKDAVLVVTSWSVLLLGLLVVRVHGSSFAYFWMTAGLFVSVGLAMVSGQPLALAGRMTWVIGVSLVAMSALQSAHESVEMLDDTQWEQRETMRLAGAPTLRQRRGYQVEGALFCSRDPDPLPAMFSQGIWWRFKDSPDEATRFIAEFRDRPVAYIVESYRMNQFPPQVRDFWATHYVWYARSLFVAGFRLDPAESMQEIDVIVPAEYRWVPDPGGTAAPLRVGREVVQPLDTIWLDAGPHDVFFTGATVSGSLMLADLPTPVRDAYPAFYHSRQIMQLGGNR